MHTACFLLVALFCTNQDNNCIVCQTTKNVIKKVIKEQS